MSVSVIGDLLELAYGKALKAEDRAGGRVPVVGSGGVVGAHNIEITSGKTIVVGRKGSIGSVTWVDGPAWPIDTAYYVKPKTPDLDLRWAYWMLDSLPLASMNKSAAVPGLNRDDVYRLPVALPSSTEQRRIAAILDRADAIRTKRRQVLAHLRSLAQSVFHEMFGDDRAHGRITLGQIAKWRSGGTPPRASAEYFQGEVPWFSSGELGDLYISSAREHITESALRDTAAKLIPRGSVLLGMYDTAALKSSINSVEAACNQAVAFAPFEGEPAKALFVYHAIQNVRSRVLALRRGIRQKNLNLSMVQEIQIPWSSDRAHREFAAQVRLIERGRASTERAVRAGDELFASLQSRAFRGEL